MASQSTIATSTPRSSLAYKEQAIGSKARLRDLEVPRRDSHFLSHALPHKVRCRHARSPQKKARPLTAQQASWAAMQGDNLQQQAAMQGALQQAAPQGVRHPFSRAYINL